MSDRSCNLCDYRERKRRWKRLGIRPKPIPDPRGGVRIVDAKTGKYLGVTYAELSDVCKC
jgi:hypothetical protein